MPDPPPRPTSLVNFWLALNRGGSMNFHEEGLRRARRQRLERAANPVTGEHRYPAKPAYAALLPMLDRLLDTAIGKANLIDNGEPPLKKPDPLPGDDD